MTSPCILSKNIEKKLIKISQLRYLGKKTVKYITFRKSIDILIFNNYTSLKFCCCFDLLSEIMSALFNFQSLLSVILLLICTCAYLRSLFPSIIDRNKTGLLGSFWKLARIGERKSPWVGAACVIMAFTVLFWT